MTRKYNNTVKVLEQNLVDQYGRPISSSTPAAATSAPTPSTPTPSAPTPSAPTPRTSADWVKDAVTALNKFHSTTVVSEDFLKTMYSATNVGFLAKKNITVEYIAIHDLLRLLYSDVNVNPQGANRRSVLQWDGFKKSVQFQLDKANTNAKKIFDDWLDQLNTKEPEEYIIKDAAVSKAFNDLKRERDVAGIAAYETYNTYTVYNALKVILKKRLTAAAQLQNTVISNLVGKIVPLAQYEQVLLSVLLYPERYTNADASFPKGFTENCEIRPEELRNIGLLCRDFYSSEIARLIVAKQKKELEDYESGQLKFNFESLQNSGGNMLEFIPFKRHYKELKSVNELVDLSSLWNTFKQNVTRGPAALPAARAAITQLITKYKEKASRAAERPEYQKFLKDGYIQVNTSIIDPSIKPPYNLDSKSIGIPVYSLENIRKINSMESSRLVEAIKSIAEHTSVEMTTGGRLNKAMSTLASGLT